MARLGVLIVGVGVLDEMDAGALQVQAALALDRARGHQGEVAWRMIPRQRTHARQDIREVFALQVMPDEEQGEGLEELPERLPAAAVSPGGLIVIVAGEDPGGAIQEGAVQLEDEVPPLEEARRRRPDGRPAASEGVLEGVVEVGGEHGLEARGQRGDGACERRHGQALVIEHALDDDRELGAAEDLCGDGECIDELAALEQRQHLLTARGGLTHPGERGESAHNRGPGGQPRGSGEGSAREDDELPTGVGLAQLVQRQLRTGAPS